MGAFTISAICDGCPAEINSQSKRFGCRRCWEADKAENRTFCKACALNHPKHRRPEPSVPEPRSL